MNAICTAKLPTGGVCGHVFFVRDTEDRKRVQSMCPACRSRRAKVGHRAMVQKHGYARVIPKAPQR